MTHVICGSLGGTLFPPVAEHPGPAGTSAMELAWQHFVLWTCKELTNGIWATSEFHIFSYMEVSRNGGTPSYHPLIDRIFHSKASSYWGCPMTMESHGFHPHLFELTAGCAPCLCLAQAGTRPRSGFVKNRIHR